MFVHPAQTPQCDPTIPTRKMQSGILLRFLIQAVHRVCTLCVPPCFISCSIIVMPEKTLTKFSCCFFEKMSIPFIPPTLDDLLSEWTMRRTRLPELLTPKRFRYWTNGFATTKLVGTPFADGEGQAGLSASIVSWSVSRGARREDGCGAGPAVRIHR